MPVFIVSISAFYLIMWPHARINPAHAIKLSTTAGDSMMKRELPQAPVE